MLWRIVWNVCIHFLINRKWKENGTKVRYLFLYNTSTKISNIVLKINHKTTNISLQESHLLYSVYLTVIYLTTPPAAQNTSRLLFLRNTCNQPCKAPNSLNTRLRDLQFSFHGKYLKNDNNNKKMINISFVTEL